MNEHFKPEVCQRGLLIRVMPARRKRRPNFCFQNVTNKQTNLDDNDNNSDNDVDNDSDDDDDDNDNGIKTDLIYHSHSFFGDSRYFCRDVDVEPHMF